VAPTSNNFLKRKTNSSSQTFFYQVVSVKQRKETDELQRDQARKSEEDCAEITRVKDSISIK